MALVTEKEGEASGEKGSIAFLFPLVRQSFQSSLSLLCIASLGPGKGRGSNQGVVFLVPYCSAISLPSSHSNTNHQGLSPLFLFQLHERLARRLPPKGGRREALGLGSRVGPALPPTNQPTNLQLLSSVFVSRHSSSVGSSFSPLVTCNPLTQTLMQRTDGGRCYPL